MGVAIGCDNGFTMASGVALLRDGRYQQHNRPIVNRRYTRSILHAGLLTPRPAFVRHYGAPMCSVTAAAAPRSTLHPCRRQRAPHTEQTLKRLKQQLVLSFSPWQQCRIGCEDETRFDSTPARLCHHYSRLLHSINNRIDINNEYVDTSNEMNVNGVNINFNI